MYDEAACTTYPGAERNTVDSGPVRSMTRTRSGKTPLRRGVAATGVALALVGLLAGCGTREVKQADLQQQVKTKLEAKAKMLAGQPKVGDVTCGSGLKAKVGATATCKVEVGAKKQQVTMTVTKVDGNNVYYNIGELRAL